MYFFVLYMERKPMGAKNKTKKRKKAKQEKVRRQVLIHLSRDKALELIRNLIDQEKPREAIQTLQQTAFSDTPEFLLLKTEAYALRAYQLEEKNLHQEAATVLRNLSDQLSHIPDVTCEHLARLIHLAPFSFGLNCYKQHKKRHPSCERVDKALGDRLVISRKWESLGELSDEDPLKKDGLILAEAIPQLNEGLWQEGIEKLSAISRKSPFASWRWFGKAMVSAYLQDEESLSRALNQLSDDFPLVKTVRVLKEEGSKGLETLRQGINQLDQEQTRDIVRAMDTRPDQVFSLITQFARETFPKNPDFAVRSLSEMVACELVRKDFSIENIRKILPSDAARPLLIRIRMFLGHDMDSDGVPFLLALKYLELIDTEFSHVKDKAKVEAALYFTLLSRVVSMRMRPHMLHSRDRSALKQWIGNPKLRDDDLFMALAEKITRLAPDVVFYYRVLNLNEIGWIFLSAEGKKLVEQALLRMQEHFPEDPFSYLQLAKLYWRKGAYRKSQKILEDAWKQASYDPQVREHYGLGLIRAAIKARNRGASHVAERDLEEARNLNVEFQLPLIHAIQTTIRFLEKKEEGNPLESLLALPGAVLRYRALIYFYLDLLQLDLSDAKKLAEETADTLSGELKKELDRLSGAELGQIIAPIPQDYAELLQHVRNLSGLFDPLWPKILEKLDDQQVLFLYAELLGQGGEQIRWVKKDLKKRLRKQPGNVFLEFYELLVNYLLDSHTDADDFDEFIDSLTQEEEQKLKEFCRKIAHHFDGPLFRALSSFNFFALDEDDFWMGDDDEDYEDEDWEEDWPADNPIEILAEELEGLRGNKTMLKTFFEMLVLSAIDENIEDEMIRLMGHILETKAKGAIKVLREIYSGKKGKSLGRKGMLLLFPDS